MNTKEKVILAMLDLAAKNGLKSLSMSQIAEKVGIRKPSLYNHFSSKEELIRSAYEYIREKSKEPLGDSSIDTRMKEKSAYEILCGAVLNYKAMVKNKNLMKFYKVIYSERTTDKNATEIVYDETQKMINATKTLLTYLARENKLSINDIDTAATNFALTIHGLIDYELDAINLEKEHDKNLIEKYIKWFCEINQKEKNEK